MAKESDKFVPSSEWTPEERVKVVMDLASDMVNLGNEGRFVDPLAMSRLGYRILFILNNPSDYLEVNRDQMLNGVIIPK